MRSHRLKNGISSQSNAPLSSLQPLPPPPADALLLLSGVKASSVDVSPSPPTQEAYYDCNFHQYKTRLPSLNSNPKNWMGKEMQLPPFCRRCQIANRDIQLPCLTRTSLGYYIGNQWVAHYFPKRTFGYGSATYSSPHITLSDIHNQPTISSNDLVERLGAVVNLLDCRYCRLSYPSYLVEEYTLIDEHRDYTRYSRSFSRPLGNNPPTFSLKNPASSHTETVFQAGPEDWQLFDDCVSSASEMSSSSESLFPPLAMITSTTSK
ncbi:hypothetical protein BJV82DRAFT_576325 [Fennellomyces sp. T-0311]|nr:hypothetical protein BJV82DRAFT_576325 [Fennellomyces sp. T-0311]